MGIIAFWQYLCSEAIWLRLGTGRTQNMKTKLLKSLGKSVTVGTTVQKKKSGFGKLSMLYFKQMSFVK